MATVNPFSVVEKDFLCNEQVEYECQLDYLEEKLDKLQQQILKKEKKIKNEVQLVDQADENIQIIYDYHNHLSQKIAELERNKLKERNVLQQKAIELELDRIEDEQEYYALHLQLYEMKEEIAHYTDQLDRVRENKDVYDQAKDDRQVFFQSFVRQNPKFGSLEAFASTGPLHWPTQGGHITSLYGMRKHPISGRYRMHQGLDIAGSGSIMAAADGQVEFVGYRGGYGYCMLINHGNHWQTLYAHMVSDSAPFAVGDFVQAGQVIGQMGTTGHSTGVHLHFEVRQQGRCLNPLDYL